MSMKYRRAFRETLCGYSGQWRSRLSRDLQSSFRDTTVPLNTMTSTAEFRRSAVHRSTRNLQDDNLTVDGRSFPDDNPLHHRHRSDHGSPSSSGAPTDVLVMISPANGNAQCYKTLLRVTVAGSKPTTAAANATTGLSKTFDSYETQTENPHCIEIETCI